MVLRGTPAVISRAETQHSSTTYDPRKRRTSDRASRCTSASGWLTPAPGSWQKKQTRTSLPTTGARPRLAPSTDAAAASLSVSKP